MKYNNFQVVCLNTVLKLLFPGPNLGVIISAAAGSEKPPSLKASQGPIHRLCQAQRDPGTLAFSCSLYFPINSLPFKQHSSCVSCTKAPSQGRLALAALQQPWQISFSFACCGTWNFTLCKVLAVWHLAAAGQCPLAKVPSSALLETWCTLRSEVTTCQLEDQVGILSTYYNMPLAFE